MQWARYNRKKKDAAAANAAVAYAQMKMWYLQYYFQSTESKFSFFSFNFLYHHWWHHIILYVYFTGDSFYFLLLFIFFLSLWFYSLFCMRLGLFVCSMHTIDYGSLLSNRGIKFHQFFRSFDYSMKFQFFNLFLLLFFVIVVGFVRPHFFFISTNVHVHFYFLLVYPCPSSVCVILISISISMLQFNNKSLKTEGKNQWKISHFNIERDIAPVDVCLL